MKSHEAIELLVAFFEKNGWPMDIDSEKLWKRSSLSKEPYKPGWVVVEIERHRGILGESYVRGLPMNSYQIYWIRYAINIKSGFVKNLPERKGELYIDIEDLVSQEVSEQIDFEINPLKGKKYQIYDTIGKGERIISTIEEAKSFALDIVEGWNDLFVEFKIAPYDLDLTKEQIEIIIRQYKESLDIKIIKLVESRWKDRDE